jgi:hypothetical protein
VRIWTDDIDAAYIAQGRAGGKAFVHRMWPEWQARPAAAYELANEPDCNSNAGLASLREYTLGAIEEAAHLGIKLCVLNLAEGNPHDNAQHDPAVSAWKWQQLRPAVVAAASAGMPMGRHCYWRPGVEGPTGRWHSLGRLQWDLQTLNVPGLRVLVNECGIDGGIAGHPGKQGWQLLTSEMLYRQDIVEAERFARTLPGVEMLALFGVGAQSPWETFDIPEGFARSLVGPLKALAPPAVEAPDRRLIVELARPLAITPSTNRVSQWFGDNPASYAPFGLAGHNGNDYPAWEGTPVLAANPGIVRCYDQGTTGYGRYLTVDNVRYWTLEGHLSDWKVRDGARVNRGDVVGFSGNTGNSTGPHVHLGLQIVGMRNPAYRNWVDPTPFRTV